MSVEMTFGQVLTALGSLEDIPPEKLPALSSRIKHLQKLGLPARRRPGRGKAGRYSLEDFCQLLVALELQRRGVSPLASVRQTVLSWPKSEHTLHHVIYSWLGDDPHGVTLSACDTVWVHQFDAFSDPEPITFLGIPWARPGTSWLEQRYSFEALEWKYFVQLLEGREFRFCSPVGDSFTVLMGTRLLRRALETLVNELKFVNEAALRGEVENLVGEWMEVVEQRMKDTDSEVADIRELASIFAHSPSEAWRHLRDSYAVHEWMPEAVDMLSIAAAKVAFSQEAQNGDR